jgi:hypothetical protein
MKGEALGASAVTSIAQVWQIDASRSRSFADGFDWWPGDFRVSVRVSTSRMDEHGPRVRLTIRTDLLRQITIRDPKFVAITASTALFAASTYAWVYQPSKRSGASNAKPSDGRLWSECSAYLSQDNVGWLPKFVASTSLLQPINAQLQAELLTEALGGIADVSGPTGRPLGGLDEMLDVASKIYIPLGQEPSRWIGCREFEEFAEQWARTDLCFGMGDPTGLTFETPMGKQSILVRLHTSESHPQLGHGLLGTIQVPAYFQDMNTVAALCGDLNFLEAASWTDFPQFGCWHPDDENEEGRTGLAFSTFIPNALYQQGLTTQTAHWLLQRARWVRREKWPQLQDLRMSEILDRRFRGPAT